MPWALLRNAEILKLLRKQFQKFSVRSKNPSLIKLRTEICVSVEHSLTCTCPHMGWVPALTCCHCDQERTNPGTHLAPRRSEGAQSLPSHRAFAQSWEEKKNLVLGSKTILFNINAPETLRATSWFWKHIEFVCPMQWNPEVTNFHGEQG